MLFLDVNVLVHTFRPRDTADGAAVRDWLMQHLAGHERLGITEHVLSAMVRIVTNARIFNEPAAPLDAVAFADSLLAAPNVAVLRPQDRHWAVFRELVTEHRLRGNDVPNAYLAALALENGATMVTRDRGFRRFAQLRTIDPLG